MVYNLGKEVNEHDYNFRCLYKNRHFFVNKSLFLLKKCTVPQIKFAQRFDNLVTANYIRITPQQTF